MKKKREMHGKTNTSIYRAWESMIQRCHNPNSNGFVKYGARGITVCKRWRYSFLNFYADMGDKPSPKHTLDRKDGFKGYTPDNCRWATYAEQNNNKRTNALFTLKGKTQPINLWCKELNVPYTTVRGRLNLGLTAEQCFGLEPFDHTRTYNRNGLGRFVPTI